MVEKKNQNNTASRKKNMSNLSEGRDWDVYEAEKYAVLCREKNIRNVEYKYRDKAMYIYAIRSLHSFRGIKSDEWLYNELKKIEDLLLKDMRKAETSHDNGKAESLRWCWKGYFDPSDPGNAYNFEIVSLMDACGRKDASMPVS